MFKPGDLVYHKTSLWDNLPEETVTIINLEDDDGVPDKKDVGIIIGQDTKHITFSGQCSYRVKWQKKTHSPMCSPDDLVKVEDCD